MERRPSVTDLVLHDAATDIPEDGSLLSPTSPGTLSSTSSRLHRASLNRQRSSAASSRRNSLSSTHSHSSHHSHHSHSFHHKPQSSHVAQHLRRASILETRRARLAARAAHAETVRMRAALAKSSPRQSNTEERALAAQQARQKHLAQIAASCAEEVRRAKRVAEDMKERREVEEKRARDEMEERLAEAERRRSVFLDKRSPRKSRTGSTSAPPDAKKLSASSLDPQKYERAARCIQSAWRAIRRRRAVIRFQQLGMSIETVTSKTMEEVTALLATDQVIEATKSVLSLTGVLDTTDPTELGTAVRTFLCTFLILGHPTEVLRDDGEQERDLIQKAKDLLICFEQFIVPFGTLKCYSPLPAKVRILREAHSVFTNAFTAWKDNDCTAIVQTMVAQYVELDSIWLSVKDNAEEIVAHDFREGIREAQILLLVRIKRMAGPEKAKAMIKDAIREARRKRPKKPVGDVRPRAAAETTPPVPSFNELKPDQKAAIATAESLTQPSIQEHRLPLPPLGTVFLSRLPDNRALVHELAINKDFRITTNESNGYESVRTAIIKSMRSDFATGSGDQWIISMASFIRENLLRLLRPESSIAKLVSEVLDPELVKNEVSRGAFSQTEFFNFVNSILPKICAPARDEAVKALAEKTDGDDIDRLEELFKVLDLLLLDHANFTLDMHKADLIKAAPAYEADKFEKDLNSRKMTLDHARQWYSKSRDKAVAETERRDPEGIRLAVNAPTFRKIYTQGLVDLATSVPVSANQLARIAPEMFALDIERLVNMQKTVLNLAVASSILLTAKNLLKQDVRSHWKHASQRLLLVLKNMQEPNEQDLGLQVLGVITSYQKLTHSAEEHLTAFVSKVLEQAASGRISDPVFRLIRQRLSTHIQSRLLPQTATERVRAESGAGEALAKSGLPEFGAEVGKIVEELGKIRDFDWESHSKWWTEIEQGVIASSASASSPSSASHSGSDRGSQSPTTSSSS